MNTKNTKFHFDNVYMTEPIHYGAIRLTQIGDLCSKSGFQVKEHVQYCHEISYIVSGSGVFKFDKKSYAVKSGDVFFSKQNSIHSIKSSSRNPLRFFYFGFHFDISDPGYSLYKDIDVFFQKLDFSLVIDKFNVFGIFNNVFNEIIQDYEKKELLIKTCLEQIVLYSYRDFSSKHDKNIALQDDIRYKNDIVYNIINYIDNNILNIVRLTDIGNYIGYSYSYASKIFSSVMNESLGVYYQKVRFQKAIELMKNKTSITQTAEILGFDSINSFSRSFKKHFGESPKTYISKI